MVLCKKCGNQVDESASVCSKCGASVNTHNKEDLSSLLAGMNDVEAVKTDGKAVNLVGINDYDGDVDPSDVKKNRFMAALAYMWILVLIPMFCAKDSKFARYHTNQGFVLFLVELGYGVAFMVYALVMIKISIKLLPIVHYSMLLHTIFVVISLIGIAHALAGKKKKIPIFGKIQLLRK